MLSRDSQVEQFRVRPNGTRANDCRGKPNMAESTRAALFLFSKKC